MADNKTKFWPVRGKEAQVLSQSGQDGKIYFTTDTNRIYLDVNGSKHLMGGGNSGIIYAYGTEEQIRPLSEDDDEKNFSIVMDALENPSVEPKKDDLILNSDGRFFRVVSINSSESVIYAQLLAVSGSGGGGGGTVVKDISISYDASTIESNTTYVYQKDYYALITAHSDVASYVRLGFVISQGNNQIMSFGEEIANDEYYRFNMALLPKGNDITIAITATSLDSSYVATKTFGSISTVELKVDKYAYANTVAAATGAYGLRFVPAASSLSQALHVLIDGEEMLLEGENSSLNNFVPNGNDRTVRIPQQNHGVHEISLYTTITINQTVLTSNVISYEVAWIEEGEESPLIWLGDFNKTVVNYDQLVIPFMVYDPAAVLHSEKAKVYLYHNGAELPTSPMEVNYSTSDWNLWDVTDIYNSADGQGAPNLFTLTCGSASKDITVYVTNEGSRDLGLVEPNALILNLNASGRSNSETSSSRSTWTYNNYSTEFNQFNWYNNGWKTDGDSNGAYLSVANGANAAIHFTTLAMNSGRDYSIEVRFRVRNIQEYSTLVRTIPMYYVEENGQSWTVEDIERYGYHIAKDGDGYLRMDKNSPKVISTEEGIAFKFLNNAGYGFAIGTQEAYFRTPSGIANVRYKEDEVINLSFVVSSTSKLMSIYLNGILSGALDLNKSVDFTMDNEYFYINSNFCDFDLYKLRVYDRELIMPEVIHNYISDIKDIALYDQNQLTDKQDGTILWYHLLKQYNEKNPNNPSMPYAVWEIIDNGTGISDPNKGTHSSDDDRLPFFKGNNRYVKITFVNPPLDRALEKGLISEDFYYDHSPSFVAIGADINVQGTSSQGYPRRNFKTKMKSASSKKDATKTTHDDWGWYYTKGSKAGENFSKWHMDSENCSTNKFTWKIDYMESSGTYNTGFANLVGNNIYNNHPLATYSGFTNQGEGYRTSVYGFPVMVFHKHSTTTDRNYDADTEYLAYEYIGRYNLNLDKSSNEYYGFELDDEQPYVTNEWDEEIDGEIVHKTEHPAIADVAECWELRDNQGTWTSFKYPDAASRSTGFATQTDVNTLEVAKHFEARYNNEADQFELCTGAASAEDLGWDVNAVERADGSIIDLSSQTAKNNFIREKMRNLEDLFDWLDSVDMEPVPETDTGAPLDNPETYETTVYYMVDVFPENNKDVVWYVDSEGEKLVKVSDVSEVDSQKYYVYMVDNNNIMTNAIAPANYTGTKRPKDDILITYNTDCKGRRLKKFVKEFNKYLNLEYCVVYFILTELLLCYDSRGKNLMLASWGPNADSEGHYVWFPIFYDIDTQLGLNNIGAVLWDYDTDATLQGTFSTANSVLWQNLFAGFRDRIEETYRMLRKSSRLTETTIEGAYLCDPEVFSNSYAMQGVRPVIALGLDEWYKYIACGINKNEHDEWYSGTSRRFGFYSQTNQGREKVTDAQYIYDCQGDRKLSRELFIRNRLNYLDSWWLAGAYDSKSSAYKNEIMIRANANDLATSDTYLDISKVSSDVVGYERAAYPVDFYDAIPQFTITPFLSQYVTVFYDEDPITPTIKYDGINPVRTNTTPAVATGYKITHPYNEQLTYIPGGDFLSDIGDLSLKYPSHFKLSTGKRLTQLLIGGDAPGYVNGIIGKESGTFDLNNGANSSNKKGLLQKIVLTGLSALTEAQDVSGSEKLREFRALNTKIPYVTFAEGAPLDTVHLPKTTSYLKLTHAKNLTRILTSPPEIMVEENGTYVYNDLENYQGLYVEGVTDWDKANESSDSRLQTINLSNVNLGYDSYKLLDNAIDIRERFKPNDFLAINLEEVNWSPYVPIEADTVYSPNKTFYVLTEHSNFKQYQYTSEAEWEYLKLNGVLYTYNNDPKESYITSTALLDTIINDYEAAINVATNHYRSAVASDVKTLPNITGTMFISNFDTQQSRIAETLIQERYQRYFPNLQIYAKYIAESYVAKFVQVLDNGREEQVGLKRYPSNQVNPDFTSITTPNKSHYDFLGWATDRQGQNIVASYENGALNIDNDKLSQLVFSQENSIITFYAIFEQHQYKIHYLNTDGTELFTNTPYSAVYGAHIPDPQATPISAQESALSEITQTYRFKGYVKDYEHRFLNTDAEVRSYILKLDEEIVIADTTLYAAFKLQSVYDEPTNIDYFTFTPYEYNEPSILPNSVKDQADARFNVSLGNGVQIDIKPGVKLSGKISLPTHDKNGIPVIAIGSTFSASRNTETWQATSYGGKDITHIFWYRVNNLDPQLRIIKDSCFYCAVGSIADGHTSLKYIELPDTLRIIGNSSFFYIHSLDVRSLELPPNLLYIGQNAFDGAFNENISGTAFTIPASVVDIDNLAFRNFASVETFRFGLENNPSKLTYLGGSKFVNDSWTGYEIFSTRKAIPNRIEFYASVENQVLKFPEVFTNKINGEHGTHQGVAPMFNGIPVGSDHRVFYYNGTYIDV